MITILQDTSKDILVPIRITRKFIQQHPELIFVYSNDYHNKGCEGMAWSFHGEPNAYMIPTMKKMCKSATDKYWRDDVKWIEDVILEAIAKIPRDGRPIIVATKIGCGCSRMFEFAPKLFKLMKEKLAVLSYKQIVWT